MVGNLPELEAAPKSVGAGQFTELYISIIDSQAERADIEDYKPRTDKQPLRAHPRRPKRIPAQSPPKHALIRMISCRRWLSRTQ